MSQQEIIIWIPVEKETPMYGHYLVTVRTANLWGDVVEHAVPRRFFLWNTIEWKDPLNLEKDKVPEDGILGGTVIAWAELPQGYKPPVGEKE